MDAAEVKVKKFKLGMSDQQVNEMELVEPERPMFGEDLRIDSEDEENLENLPEIERELILEERFRILQKYKDEKALYDKFAKKDEPVDIQKPKSTSGTARGKRQSDRSPRVYEDSPSASSSVSSSSSSDSSYISDDEDEEAAVLKSKRATAATDQSIADTMSATLTIELVRKTQLTRDMLLNSFQKVPTDLRNEALIDSFVRVPNGEGGYVIGQILSVEDIPRSSRTSDSGKFNLITSIPNPESSTTKIPVQSVSNSEISDFEFARWIVQVGDDFAHALCPKIGGTKIGHIKTILNFVWDDSVINRMLEEKKRTNRSNSVKLTLEIAKLRTTLQAELGRLNNALGSEEQRKSIQENINRINSEIHGLEQAYKTAQRAFEEANAHQYGIVAINHRNRTQQRIQEMEEARKRHKKLLHPDISNVAGGNKQLNPFKRRECKPVVMWDVGKRSPKKEPVVASTDTMTDIDIATPAATTRPNLRKKQTISTNIESFVREITAAISGPKGTSRLGAVQQSMASSYSKNEQLPIWKSLRTSSGGEVMSFDEWKRRVAEDEAVNE